MKRIFNRKKVKKSVVVGWAFSYIIILLIPFISIFINYHYNVQVIRKGVIQTNMQALKNLQVGIDEYLKDEQSMYSYLYLNEYFHSMLAKENGNSSFLYDAHNLQQQLLTYSGYNEGVSCLLYFMDKEYVLNTGNGNKDDYFYQSMKFFNSDMADFERWREVMTAEYDNEFVIMDFLHHETTKDCIVYADTLTLYQDNRVNIFVSIPVDFVVKMTKAIGDKTYFVVESNDKVILTILDGQVVGIEEDVLKLTEKEVFFEDNDFISIRQDSVNNGVSYYLIVPKEEFWKEARHTRNVLAISTSITLVIGGLCVTHLLRRNFRPISNLLSKIGAEDVRENEFARIERVYERIVAEKGIMQEQIINQKEREQKLTLLTMMKGCGLGLPRTDEQVIDLLDEEGICLVGFEVPLCDENQFENNELLFFIIDNIFSELMEGEKFYRIEDGRYLFYLFIISEKNAVSWKTRCMERMNYICEIFDDKLSVVPGAAVSKWEKELEQIKYLYQDIMKAFEFRRILGGNAAIDTDILNEDSNSLLLYSSESGVIEYALQKGDHKKMITAIEEFLKKAGSMPILVFKMQVLGMFQAAVKIYCDYELDEGKRMYLVGYLKTLLDAANQDAIGEILKDIFNYVYEALHGQEQDDNKSIVVSVREYIEKHYTDSTLNISTIANNIGRKPKYISAVFKKETQEGILDYINNIRIGKAQILLATGKYSVEEVSEMVGYASSKTFRRAFFKTVGKTPGKFT